MEDTKTIRFKKPITLDDVTYEKIALREPLAGEMERAALGKTGIAYNIILISEVGGMPRDAVRLIPKRQLEACIEYLVGFTNDDQLTDGAS